MEIIFPGKLSARLKRKNNDGTWEVEFNKKGAALQKVVDKIGQVPLPPYIKRNKNLKTDKKTYQTVYARAEKNGSVAAPTAGFHFTPQLLKKIKKMGIEILEVTLHVGLGTFAPVKTENISAHQMHNEYLEIKKAVMQKIIRAKKERRRIIAVGTTSARVLETFGQALSKNPEIIKKDFSAWTNIFIYPPYKFKIVDALITNFHLPKSTLLMLVSSLASKANIDKAYKIAINREYRFFSYGDAMFIR